MLKDIIRLIAGDLGRDPTDPIDKVFLLDLANRAATDLYKVTDLPFSLFEQAFNFTGLDSGLVVLPQYVGEVRGLHRIPDSRKVEILALGMRYHYSGMNDSYHMQYNEFPNSCLEHDLENDSVLTFELTNVESEDVKITVVGASPNSSRAVETVVIPAGQLSVTTTTNFRNPLEAIYKEKVNNYDINVFDASGTKVATLANHYLESIYKVVQVSEPTMEPITVETQQCLEVIFKLRFSPFINDYDTFLRSNRFDDILHQNALKLHYSGNTKSEGYALAQKEAARMFSNLVADYERSKVRKVDQAEDKIYNLLGRASVTMYANQQNYK